MRARVCVCARSHMVPCFVGTACILCRAWLCTNTKQRVAVELWKCQPLPLLTGSTISSFLGVVTAARSLQVIKLSLCCE